MRKTTTAAAAAAARTLLGLSLLLASFAGNAAAEAPAARTPDPTFHVDLKQAVGYLASDELEGRGIDTAGINKAADYIANTFDKLGLVPMGDDHTYFQNFKTTTSSKLGPDTTLTARLPDRDEAEKYGVKVAFVPMRSGEGTFEGDLVVAGYGISNPHAGYDDYKGLDVKGKVVLILRYEPHDAKGNSRFTKVERKSVDDNGPEIWSESAGLDAKAKAAADHGAAAVLFVTPPNFHRPPMMTALSDALAGPKGGIPMLHVSPAAADQWLKAGGAKYDLKALQNAIDSTGDPVKIELSKPVRVSGKVQIVREQRDVKNVVALLPGTDTSDSREYVVIGAHYDHLGYGGVGSFVKAEAHQIHNGADDNASGTSAMLETAERFARAAAEKPGDRPKRSLIFIAFTAEEEGLIGSHHFVEHPTVPLEKIVAMLNLDMVGRVRNGELSIGGFGTAPSFERFMKESDAASPLVLTSLGKSGYGPSDHMSFAAKKVPVLFFFSGVHRDYHRPTDDVEKINFKGMEDVVNLAVDMTHKLLAMPRETYVDAADVGAMTQLGSPSGGIRATLGIIPVYGEEKNNGCEISGATPGSPAAAAGLKDKDVITRWNDRDVTNLMDLTEELRKGKPGDKVKLKVLRDSKTIDVEATLAERKG